MSDAIEPVEQREIDFHNDKVTAVVAKDGTVYVPVRPLCDLIGVDWASQRKRINRDEILSDVSMSVVVTTTHIDDSSRQRKTQNMIALPLDYLNGWLFGMNASRVSEDIRPLLLRYQRECYKVLFEAFSSGVATRPDDELMQSDDPSAVSFRALMHMAKLAREQYYLTQRVDEHDRRLGLIEAQLSNPAALITQAQAQQISEAVKSIAIVLGNQSGMNEFGGVYGEMYRRYGITSYKRLPAAKFETVMQWLRSWWIELTGQNQMPF